MSRAVRGLEHAMIALGEEMGPVLVAARLAGRVPPEAVSAGLERVRQRHPALCTRLQGGRWELAGERGAIPLFVRNPGPLPGDSRAGWERVVEAELRWPIDLGSGVPLRVVVVPEPGMTTVILAAHRALVDTASLGTVLHETLCATAEAMGGPEVSLPALAQEPTLLEALPVPAPLRWLAPVLPRLWREREVLPCEGVGVLRSFCAFRRGTAAGLRRLRVACDEHDLSPGEVALAAAAVALMRRRTRQGALELDTHVDLRQRANVPPNAVGSWSSPVRVALAQGSRFWDLARSARNQVRGLVSWDVPLLVQVAAERGHLPGSAPLVSALEPWKAGTSYGSFALLEVYALHGMVARGAPLGLWLREMPDGLCIDAVAAGPAVSRATLEQLLDEVLAVCEAPPEAGARLEQVATEGRRASR
jgi:hypothetical protein